MIQEWLDDINVIKRNTKQQHPTELELVLIKLDKNGWRKSSENDLSTKRNLLYQTALIKGSNLIESGKNKSNPRTTRGDLS